jgi:uncharacterized protein YjbI with pentapeptide repeats
MVDAIDFQGADLQQADFENADLQNPGFEDADLQNVDCRGEATQCLRLAESETQSEVKTILMGMALGWLTLAHHVAPSVDAHDAEPEPADGPIEEPVDELV